MVTDLYAKANEKREYPFLFSGGGSGSTRFTTFPTVQLGMANTSAWTVLVRHSYACFLAIQFAAYTLFILRNEELQKKTASNRPASGYRRSRVAASKSDVDEDSHHKMESSNESISSDDTSETPTSEESSPSDSSESDFFEDWNKRRPSRRPRKCQPKTPKKPPPRTEAETSWLYGGESSVSTFVLSSIVTVMMWALVAPKEMLFVAIPNKAKDSGFDASSTICHWCRKTRGYVDDWFYKYSRRIAKGTMSNRLLLPFIQEHSSGT
ncbi:hypothetical protein CLF_113110 [Clonorchis sinensis]|uniref:Uncharacterized protein n=1 Tax=Clonorchis sinensis TaxID=79923 RepID=G7YXN0_CLOSI|nr:hypothetical protein CLF_113110 [Clonorchis sinensis]